MQSGALFPLTLLFAFSSGLVWFHISLEVIAGISTYFLARRLSLPVFFATFAGILFALNGTYAWLGNSVLNPVAFLPMAVLGIENGLRQCVQRQESRLVHPGHRLGPLALRRVPRVAYIDGLLVLGWAVVRFFNVARLQRPRAARRVVLGGVMGVVLALPILVPFYDDLKVGFIGSHTSAVDGALGLPHFALPRSSIPMSMVRSFRHSRGRHVGRHRWLFRGERVRSCVAWPLRIKESAAAHLPRRVDSRRDGRYL